MTHTLDPDLRTAIRQRFGSKMAWCIPVRHEGTDFAACCDVPAPIRNSTGQLAHWAVWRRLASGWSLVFTFEATVDADEESIRLDALFASHEISPDLRRDLMYDDEQAL